MKIIQVNALYGEKSTGTIVKELDLLIQQRGFESYVAYRETTEDPNQGLKVGNNIEYAFHAVRTRIDGKQGYCSAISTTGLIKKLERIKPDVIHLHNVHSNFLHLPILVNFAKRNHIALVLTLHDCWFFTGKCYHFADIACEKWKTGCGDCPKRRMDIPSTIKDSSASVYKDRIKMFDYDRLYVVGCSKWITRMAKQSPIFAKANIRSIYNGLDTAVFKPNAGQREISTRFLVVTMANKWFEPENKDTRTAVLDFLGDDSKIMIIGCDENEIKACENDPRIICKGYIKNRSQLASLYAQGDVFLNLTHIDNLPTVNMEALSCGTPVITFDAGGSGELVVNGKTGFVVDVDDATGIIEALNRVRQGEIQSADCRRYAEKEFDKNSNFEKYLHLYDEIMGTRR